jgi:hypothetical protein
MDEVHFQQPGSRCRLWVPPEVDDPVCLHAPTRKSISFFGAVRLHDGKLVLSRPEVMFDARTCWDFLRQFERPSRRAGREVVVISAILRAKAFLLSGFVIFDVEYAAELAAVEDETTFHKFRLFVRSYETERGFGCISYTKRAANPVVASDCRVIPE